MYLEVWIVHETDFSIKKQALGCSLLTFTFFANNFREKSLLELRKEICFGSTNSSQCSEIDQKNYRVNGIATIMDKIFETNCSFHLRGALREKFNFCFSGSIENFLFW